ncbi:extensin family protein [Schlegelella sp. ID0723]|uniref:Extensin family protein n=1 Tax=Piscinibacter koreensis TaxID=2742824 RepID=A0A7Y6NK60_9BURK|nr:extensin family protein [Schlegelella koreensis]
MALLVVVGTAIGLALQSGALRIPPEWNPWAPLAVADPTTLVTRFKLRRLADDPVACRAALDTSALRFASEPDRSEDGNCGWRDAVRVSGLPARVGTPFVLTCPAAVSLALWEHHRLQPLARQHFGQPVVRVDHYGSYACRNVRGGVSGRRSEHAGANALDVAGFTLADGRRITVARDWAGSGPASAFLHDVHAGACDFWNVVLSPNYNAAHRDHLHLDRAPYRVCR